MNNTVIYIRRSAADDPNTVSTGAQAEICTKFTTDPDWAGVGGHRTYLKHTGVSGGNRSRFETIDANLKQANAKYLVVYTLDRLSRDVEGLLHWLSIWEKRGVEVYATDRGRISLKTAASFFITSIEAVVAEHYRRQISEKTKAALAIRRAQGKPVSHPPYGWQVINGQLEKQAAEQAIIDVIAQLDARGFGSKNIQRELFNRGIRSRKGGKFSASTIQKIRQARQLRACPC